MPDMTDTPSNEDLERAMQAPITGSEVSAWALDVIEQLYTDGMQLNDRSRATCMRLAELGDPERIMERMAETAALLLHQVHLQTALPGPGGIDEADEKFRRGFLSTRSVYRGDGPRNPFLHSDQG